MVESLQYRKAVKDKERNKYGAPNDICAYGFKSPPKLIRIDEAQRIFSESYLK